MVLRNVTFAEMDVEMAKCEVVCANCHAVRTAERGYPMPLRADVAEIEVVVERTLFDALDADT
jgi:hypothetical protein